MSRKQSTPRICSVEGCENIHIARGFCRKHYDAWKRKPNRKTRQPKRICSFPGCDGPHEARGLCKRHYRLATKKATKEKRRSYQRAWRKAHPGWTRDNQRAARALHPTRSREYSRRWRQLNPERALAQAKARYERRKARSFSTPTRIRHQSRAGSAGKLAANHRYRAAKNEVISTFTAADWLALVARSTHCFWCGKPFNKSRRPTHDHIVPLSEKGPNTPQNSVCACFICNTRKGPRRFDPVSGQGIVL